MERELPRKFAKFTPGKVQIDESPKFSNLIFQVCGSSILKLAFSWFCPTNFSMLLIAHFGLSSEMPLQFGKCGVG